MLTIIISFAGVFETSAKTTQPEVLYRIDSNGNTYGYSIACIEGTKWLLPHNMNQSPQQIFTHSNVGSLPISCYK